MTLLAPLPYAFRLPPHMKVKRRDKPTVTIVILSYTRAKLAEMENELVLDAIDEKLSFPDDPSGFKMRNPRLRAWGYDGKKHLFSKTSLAFPIGFVETVRRVLVKQQYRVKIEDRRKKLPKARKPKPLSIQLRYYQDEAVRSFIPGERGIFRAPTGSGKTFTAAGVIAALGHPRTLWITHRTNLVKQTRGALSKALGLKERKIGFIGDGRWKARRITVAMLPALTSYFHLPREIEKKVETLEKKEREKIPKKNWTDAHEAELKEAMALLELQLKGKMKRLRAYLNTVELLILDECFPAGTLVGSKPIDQIRVGDTVPSFSEATGLLLPKRVTRVFKSPATLLLRLHFGKRVLICTPGHPLLTRDGWKPAVTLTSGSMVLYCREHGRASMQSLWRASFTDEVSRVTTADLRQMSQGPRGEKKETDFSCLLRLSETNSRYRQETPRSVSETWKGVLLGRMPGQIRERNEFPYYGVHESKVRVSQNETQQPYVTSGSARQGVNHLTTDGASTSSIGRQRSASSKAAKATVQPVECKATWMASGVSAEHESLFRASELYSHRHCAPSAENCSRSGWGISLWGDRSRSRPAQDDFFTWARLDRVEILQRESNGEFEKVCPKSAVYNLEVEDTHTYLANGFVAHNCHHAAAGTWKQMADRTPARWRLGLSGTPLDREDGKSPMVIAACGPVLHQVKAKKLIAEGKIAAPDITFIPIIKRKLGKTKRLYEDATDQDGDWHQVYTEGIVENDYRNHKALSLAERATTPVMLIVERVHHANVLKEMGDKLGISLRVCHGRLPKAKQQHILNLFRSGKIKRLVATGELLGEGSDIPAIRTVIVCAGGKSVVRTIQRIGRGMRIHGNKKFVIVYDFFDHTHRILYNHSKARLKACKREGYDTTVEK